MRCPVVVALSLLVVACSPAEQPQATQPAPLTPTQPSHVTADRPPEPRPVPRDDGQSDPRSKALEATLLSFLAGRLPGFRIVDSADLARPSGGSTTYEAAVLIADPGGRHGTVHVQLDDPAITRAVPECADWAQPCVVREVAAGSALVYEHHDGERGHQGYLRVVLHRPDLSVPVRITCAELVSVSNSEFWTGGRPLPEPPLDADDAVELAELVGSLA